VVKILGGKSGFRTVRDILIFAVGLGVLIYHLVTTQPADYNVAVFIFSGGLMGAPYVIGRDESKGGGT